MSQVRKRRLKGIEGNLSSAHSSYLGQLQLIPGQHGRVSAEHTHVKVDMRIPSLLTRLLTLLGPCLWTMLLLRKSDEEGDRDYHSI